MRNKIVTFFMVFPTILVIVGSTFAFVNTSSTGIPEDQSSMLVFEAQNIGLYGTLFSPIFIFILFSVLGLGLFVSKNETTKNIGTSLYSIGFMSSMLMFISTRQHYLVELDRGDLTLGLGGYLFFFGSITGLIIALFIASGPIISELANEYYNENASRGNSKDIKKEGIFVSLKQWKVLLEEKVILPKEYEALKQEAIEKFNPKKNNLYNVITELKTALNQGLISEEDFVNIKNEVIKSNK